MPLLKPADRAFLKPLRELTYCNPFLPERIELEREALGAAFTVAGADWNVHPEAIGDRPNLTLLLGRCDALLRELAGALERGVRPTSEEANLYEHLVLFALYHKYAEELRTAMRGKEHTHALREPLHIYARFRAEADRLLRSPPLRPVDERELLHIFRLLLADSARLSAHLRQHHRHLASRRPLPRRGVAKHVHARHAPLPPTDVRQAGRLHDADYRPVGHGQGAGGTRDRVFTLRAAGPA